jgi:hypothetical protein
MRVNRHGSPLGGFANAVHGHPQFFDALFVSRDQVQGGERLIVLLGMFDR